MFQKLREYLHQFDIYDNPGVHSVFRQDSEGFRLLCHPRNHPDGLWSHIDFERRPPGHYAVRAEGVGVVYPILDPDGRIQRFVVRTRALALASQQLLADTEIMNRPDDVRWAVEQLAWLWEQAFPGTSLPPVSITDWQADPSDLEDFADWVVANAARKPGEPPPTLPPAKNPRPF
jgi:hypothetical protein